MPKTPAAPAHRAGIACVSLALLLTTAMPRAWAQSVDEPLIITPAPAFLSLAAQTAPAQTTPPPPAQPPAQATTNPVPDDPTTRLEIYGFTMLDNGYQFEQNDPLWFDVLRPTKLPAFPDEFGRDGRWFSGVRQSRLGVKSFTPTDLGELRTIFEFELFGTGVDAGQTTFRLRHAWGELGQIGAGQSWSPFMDPDVFPNSIEYWGPNGMVFFRNVQFRWTPWSSGNSHFMVAAERPGASADQGDFAQRIELQNVRGRFPAPDISSRFRYADDWGHVQLAGIVRWMKWDDLLEDQFDLDGEATGWGVNLSSNIKVGPHVAKLQVVWGEGIENYMNDAPVDVGIRTNFGDPRRPIDGEALPLVGIVAFMDFNWSDHWTSTAGYSSLDIDNSDGQPANAFRDGRYALANLLYYPVKDVMLGGELQWGDRKNFLDGFTSDDFRIQFSVRWNFSLSVGGE
jgi:outer membrane DcaP-like protein